MSDTKVDVKETPDGKWGFNTERYLDKLINEARLNLRMSKTWKLKESSTLNETPAWDSMSTDDQYFNLVWNKLVLTCREMTRDQIRKVYEAAFDIKCDEFEVVYTVPLHVGSLARVPRHMKVEYYD